MKITKKQILDIISRVDIPAIAESYNSMSSAGKELANAAKRRFAKDYPEVDVGIDGRDGWVTVDGKKAVNMSQASGSPLSLDDVIDKMKQEHLGRTIQEESKMRVTKRQLRRIIKEQSESAPVNASDDHHWPRVEWASASELADKWHDMEIKSFDPGDPSMTSEKDSLTDSKDFWREQVDDAAMDLENELTKRIRKLALEVMKEVSESLINGECY
jgi:hypothetical protein